jgi:NADH-quinone oxidoreductase subunit M
MGLLSSLLAGPLLGAVLIMLLPPRAARPAATLVSFLALLLAGAAAVAFDPAQPLPQLVESRPWNPRVGTHLALGVDGISLPMVLLTALLGLAAVAASTGIRRRRRGYFALMLVLEAAVLGVFMARDWALFYVFWEMTLIPLFFLIDRWGGPGRHRAALNFVLYTMGGSVFLLVALLALYDLLPQHTFDMLAFAEGGGALPEKTQILLFVGLLIGFGVKLPIVPLHGWLPLAHVEAPSPVSILLSGVLLKMGAYGLLRAAATLPAAALALQDFLAVLAIASLLYGGILAWRQADLKSIVAYSSVSHMGIVLLGLAGLNAVSITGAVLQMFAHGLVAGLLFLLVGQLYESTHERSLAGYGALGKTAPRFAFFLAVGFTAVIGLPGSLGFIAELHALLGGFARWGGWLVALSLAVMVSAAYALRAASHLLVGNGPQLAGLRDLRDGQTLLAATLGGSVILLGILPAPALALIGASVRQLAARFA